MMTRCAVEMVYAFMLMTATATQIHSPDTWEMIVNVRYALETLIAPIMEHVRRIIHAHVIHHGLEILATFPLVLE